MTHICFTYAHGSSLARKQDKVILDFEGGHNLRTKPISMNEGGVAVGISCLDSPNLVPAKEFVQCINRS